MNLFYTPDIQENKYTLNPIESKHCIKVLRFNKGDLLTLVDGKGGWYETQIIDPNPKRCQVEVLNKKENWGKRPFYTHIAMAPTKNNDRFEWFVEKATEIGIDEITPILCKHSERKIIKRERIEKIAISAMKQSLKAYLPKINELTKIEDLIKSTTIQNRFIAYCEDIPKEHLQNIAKPNTENLVLIGPEGDFAPEEVDLALKNQFNAVSLGNSRLRTETAGLAACHMLSLKNETL